jgi:hypothetical protein
LKAVFEMNFFPAIGEQAEVTDPLKPIGRHMKQKSSDEFTGVQRHGAARRVGFRATIEKRDFAIGHGLDAVIQAIVPFFNKGWQIWFGPELQNGWSNMRRNWHGGAACATHRLTPRPGRPLVCKCTWLT